MPILETLVAKSQTAHKKLVLPEGMDPRVVVAANKIIENRVAEVVVLGTEEEIANSCKEGGIKERKFQCLDHKKADCFESFVAEFCEMRKKKNMTPDKAAEYMRDRIFFGSMMARQGLVDGMVAGSIASTPDMLRASFTVVGTAKGISTGSSCFVMDLARPAPAGDTVLLYSDCGVNPDPNAEQLVDIAIATASTYRALVGKQPRVAFLSFSTYGSASHKILEKVVAATKMTKDKVAAEKLDILVDGELQGDAALVPAVAKKKCAGSPIEGSANVLIFPDLNAGNICYKITERLAGAAAYGPILQGLAKPVNDLSRGCCADDIYGVAAITVCQSIG
ncbi:MAG: phosphate acetyltransferase [Lentisphaerae bacterium GWF2_52_8]|nr:MAG: phosphate acetyltransferase [Lentisphaerae bacterium GWF2_52_8]